MSRSSTERAGLSIGRDGVACARVFQGKHFIGEERVAIPLFRGAPTPEASASLVKTLRSLGSELARRYIPLHVSLPDAAARWATYELDELPATRATQAELARFRFARDGGGDTVCAAQALGREGAKPLLFAMALDAAWQRCIAQALADAGLRAWTLSPHGCRQFNRFHDQLTKSSGALVVLAPESWSLWLWDEGGRPRYVRARWRLSRDDHAGVAQEVERSILAYVQGGAGRSVARVFTAANGESDALGLALDARLREPCTRLETEPPAVAAALAS